MKKLVLSSIMMLAVCSFATAQNSPLRSAKKAATSPSFTNAAASKPEISTINKSGASAVKAKEDGNVTPINALRSDDVNLRSAATNTDAQAEKKKEAVKAAPVKKG